MSTRPASDCDPLPGTLLSRLGHVRAQNALCVGTHPAALAALRARPRVEANAVEGLLESGLLAQSVDLVVCGAAAFASRPVRAVLELARLLRPGGRAIISVPGEERDALAARLARAGFLVTDEQDSAAGVLLTAVRGLTSPPSLRLVG